MRAARRLLTLGAIAALVLVAGVATAQSDDPQVTDPDDDARVYTTASVTNAACPGCGPEGVGGVPAPDALEMTAVTFTETPRDLVIRLQVVGISEDLSQVATEDGDHGTSYIVCWDATERRCNGFVYMNVRRHDGEIARRAAFGSFGPDCNDVIPCQYQVPASIETGEPGAVEWRVPRALVANATEGETLEDPLGLVWRIEEPKRHVRFDLPDERGHAGPVGVGYRETGEYTYFVDFAGPGDPFTFDTGIDPQLPPMLRSNAVQDPADDFKGPQRPDIDVREVRFISDGHNLTVSVEKAQVREDPRDHVLWVNFGFGKGIPLLYTGYWVDDGERRFSAGGCAEYPCEDWIDLDVNATVVPGEPGWINLSLPRSEASLAGLQMSWMWAGTQAWSDHQEPGPADIPQVAGGGLTAFQADLVGPGTAFRIGEAVTDPEEGGGPSSPDGGTSLEQDAVLVSDDNDDAELPQGASLFATVDDSGPGEDAYEITSVRAEGVNEEMVRLTLSIAELRNVEPPPAWDAVLYATALETDQGRFMAAYYKENAPGQTSRQQWFCTRDTSVLTGEPGDPNQAAWTPIDGVIQPSQDSDEASGQGSGQGAVLRFNVPRECVGGAAPGELPISAFGAGTFVIRNPDSQQADVRSVDVAKLEGNRTIEPTAIEAQGANVPGGLGQPFGLESFWDIAGIAGTALASVVGAVLVRRRRSALKDYLQEIEEINQAHEDDPSGRQSALRELRDRAKDELVDGRLTENQYVVVKERIGEELAEARQEGVEEAFEDLPHRLLRKLKTMVSDGQLSPEDRRLFSTMLEDSGLNEDAKARIRRKLDVWAEETAGSG